MSVLELKKLNNDEESAFEWINNGEIEKVIYAIKEKKIRVNCLDKSGLNLLDQACFKGNIELVDFLLNNGADVNNKAHEAGYTCLMFAVLADAGVRPYATNNIGKTACELGAFVAQFECVSIISSYISFYDVDKIVNPNGLKSEKVYPKKLSEFIHKLTRTHEIYPVSLIFSVLNEELFLQERQKICITVDRLFEQQLRTKETNEVN